MRRLNEQDLDIRTLFGQALRERRLERGYSQEELAARAELHRTYVADIERGERNVSLENISKLAAALGTAVVIAGEGLVYLTSEPPA
ncbi:MAG: helix-turn-helix transcriptional regulator [Trueperaceae bacterium]